MDAFSLPDLPLINILSNMTQAEIDTFIEGAPSDFQRRYWRSLKSSVYWQKIRNLPNVYGTLSQELYERYTFKTYIVRIAGPNDNFSPEDYIIHSDTHERACYDFLDELTGNSWEPAGLIISVKKLGDRNEHVYALNWDGDMKWDAAYRVLYDRPIDDPDGDKRWFWLAPIEIQ